MEILGLPAAQVIGAVVIVGAILWGFVQHSKVNGKGDGGGGSSSSSSSSSSTPPASSSSDTKAE